MFKNLLFLCIMFFFISAPVQDNTTEIHAAMVYNFIKYTQWPNESEVGEFVIGIYGNDNVYDLMSARYNDKAKGSSKKIKIKKITHIADISKVDVLYVSKTKNKEFDGIHALTKGHPILLITDSRDLGQRGSIINMKMEGDKLKFEVNQKSVEESGLKISNQLVQMSTVI